MVVDVRMKEDVYGRSLKLALDKALVRYPYFTSKMIEKDGDFYLVHNPLPFKVEETAELHSLGNKDVNYHLIDVTYQGNTIYISYDHGLCDGRGIMPFIKTLIYYYCTHQYNKVFSVQGVRLAREYLLPGETSEPFSGSRDVHETQIPKIHKDAYALPESINSAGKNQYFRHEIKIRYANFMKFAKENNATPAIAIALLVSMAIKNVSSETDQPIVCNLARPCLLNPKSCLFRLKLRLTASKILGIRKVFLRFFPCQSPFYLENPSIFNLQTRPSDLRGGIGLDNTFKNCVGSVSLPYLPEFERISFKAQATAIGKCWRSIRIRQLFDLLCGMLRDLYTKLNCRILFQ